MVALLGITLMDLHFNLKKKKTFIIYFKKKKLDVVNILSSRKETSSLYNYAMDFLKTVKHKQASHVYK